jgi:hypothetical protein
LSLGLGARAEILTAFVEEALAYADKQRFFDGSVETVRYLDWLGVQLSSGRCLHFEEVHFDNADKKLKSKADPTREHWGWFYVDLKNPEEALFVMMPALFEQRLTNGTDKRAALKALADEGFLEFNEGPPRYTLKKQMLGGKARDRWVAIRADRSGLMRSVNDKDEGEDGQILKLVPATDNPLRDAAIGQNGGL